jgi:FlaA1/EpsC-like NDP-sugar epimerase
LLIPQADWRQGLKQVFNPMKNTMSHQPKNLLVTGGAGFIGANFVHYWLRNTLAAKLPYWTRSPMPGIC